MQLVHAVFTLLYILVTITGMSTTMQLPVASAPDVDYQSIAVRNMQMMLSVRGLKQVDLANYMGKNRQNMNRMIKTGMSWSFNDMAKAAQFFGVSIDTLMRTDLSQAELLGFNNKGGLPVADSISDGRLRRGWMLAA